jgi:hypothetical protein
MMKKQYQISVREKGERYLEPGKEIETIKRVLRAESIGNFNPIFCTYKGDKRVLVHSLEGDISDPFRSGESYLKTLYIEV